MKKATLFLLGLTAALLLCTGCGNSSPASSAVQETTVVRTELTAWPDNDDTASIPQPTAGQPDYALSDDEAGSYTVFLKNITMDEGKNYIDQLKAVGFQQLALDENDDSLGAMLQKEQVTVNISAAEGVLGIYITQISP